MDGDTGSAYAIFSFRISSDVSSGLDGGATFSWGGQVGIEIFFLVPASVLTGSGHKEDVAEVGGAKSLMGVVKVDACE